MRNRISRFLVPWPIWAALAVLVLATAGLIFWRSAEFAALEPRQDHAWFTQWVRALLESERFLPQRADGESWRVALEADARSALNVLLRQIYVVPFAVLQLGALAWYALLGSLLGVSMPMQVAISVISLSLAMAALTLFAFWIGGRDGSRLESLLLAGLTFAFVAACSFLQVFSALGPHNVAILVFVLMVAAAERWLEQRRRGDDEAARRARRATLALYSLCLFTYHGGTMLAPPVLALTLLAESHLSPVTRLRWVAGLVAWTILLMLPLAVGAWLGHQANFIGSREQGILAYAEMALSGGESGAAAFSVLTRARLWFIAQAEIFSPPGLALALAGLVGLAWRRRIRAPLILALVHLACGAVVPFFMQYDRTSAYLLPFLALGAAWMVATAALAVRSRPAALPVLALVLALAAWHAAIEWPRLREPARVAGWQPYLSRQGGWLPTQREIEALLPPEAVLIPWDYQVSHLYSCFRRTDGGGPRLYVPLSTLSDRHADGSLAVYLTRRRLALPAGRALYLLAPASEPSERLAARIMSLNLSAVPPRPLAQWHDRPWPLNYPALVLYELRPAQ